MSELTMYHESQPGDLRGDGNPLPILTGTVEIVIPVYNEEAGLARAVRTLTGFLAGGTFPWRYAVTIADNASTDRTWQVAEQLAESVPGVRAVRLEQKGRGRALRQVWLRSDAEVVAYMDVDLSTDLRALVPLVAPLMSGHSDLAIGSRLTRSSRVVRGPKREFISRSYNLILRTALGVSFSDAQCGFKAIRTDVARRLLPVVEDGDWFFDTELLTLAQRIGLRIHEVPVDWTDDPDSRVDIASTATEDLKGVWRLIRGFSTGRIPVARLQSELMRPGSPSSAPGVPRGLAGQLIRFGVVGVFSTLAYFALYLALRPALGAQASNFIALLTTAVLNTAVNRSLTFNVRGTQRLVRDHIGGLLAFGVGLGLTSGSLWLVHMGARPASRTVEVAVLVVANAAATLFRFIVLRQMLHTRRRHQPPSPQEPS